MYPHGFDHKGFMTAQNEQLCAVKARSVHVISPQCINCYKSNVMLVLRAHSYQLHLLRSDCMC